MESVATFLNTTGKSFVGFSTSMLIQSSVLIIVLLVLNVFLRKRVRVVFLYCIWMLLLVKLVLPTTLSSPIGIGYWLGDKVPRVVTEKVSYIPKKIASTLQRNKPVSQTIPYTFLTTDLSSVGASPEFIADTSTHLTIAASPAKAMLSWQGFVFLGWLTVVIAMVILLIRRMFVIRGLLSQSKNPNDSIVDVFERCRKQMRMYRPISLELSPLAVSPSACGIFRPKILIPQDLPRKLKADDLRSVLLHELAHIKRGDVWVSFIQTILQIAYFYNPLLWMANVIIRKVREQAVDEMVLVAMGEKAEDYPETLLNISRMVFGRPALNLRMIGIVESKKALERRIMIMLSRPVPKSSKLGICGLIAIVVIGAVILPMGYNPTGQTALARSFMEDSVEGGIIIPGVRIGEYTFDMSKDEVLEKFGEPRALQLGEDEDDFVRRGQERYDLKNLPKEYILYFNKFSFYFERDSLEAISVFSPLYRLRNGLRIGDTKEKVIDAFGEDYNMKELFGNDYLIYKVRGIAFQIHKRNQTVSEIVIFHPEGEHKEGGRDVSDQRGKAKHIIIPGLRVGDYTFNMTKDDILERLGKPGVIFGDNKYTLDNLPEKYFMPYEDISFLIVNGSVKGITVLSPSYKFANGLRVGDSEQKVKEAFGNDFNIREFEKKDFLSYKDEGLMFEINKQDRTVMEINVSPGPASKLYRKADIPPTSYINEKGRLVDKTDYPFVNDPKVIGGWKTVDFVRKIKDFNPHKKSWKGKLWLNHIIFEEGGTMPRANQTWTKGLVLSDDTASKYIIKEIDGAAYMFYEWKSGDYTIRYMKPYYYVLKKVLLESLKYEPKYGKKANIVDKIIVPGVRVGEYTLGISKDEVLEELGEPESIQLEEDGEVIRRGEEKYNLNNLPREFIMTFGNFSFVIEDDLVNMIFVRSPIYKLSKGLGVGDSEQRIKQVFGDDFQLEEALGKDYLCYHTKGLAFEIDEKKQTIAEIVVYKPEGDSDDPDVPDSAKVALIRQAAADGRISYKLTTPDEFKAIAGRPTREWAESDDEVISMEYPGIRVRFFGKPELWPHTLVHVSCEEGRIDIGQDRPITLRNEKDLDKFGTFWGYSSVDLSRLDLSQQGELLKKMPFDSRTVWPGSDRLPPDFDPKAVLEWGKYPGLRVKQLHDQDIKGKGVHVAIIDQPLLLGHIEYKDQLVSYKEIETGNADPQMHGPPVASILVGKTCGVAPEAILHYWAEPSWKGDYKYRCMALEQIIQFNKGKEKSEQIRVVSISKGFSPSEPNLDRWKTLLEKAKKSGIYVVHCSSMGFGAGCRFMKDSDNPSNFRLCSFYGGDVYRQSGTFFTPIDHRTTASHRARDAYTFWTRSGLSWGAPYYAGVVVLGIQVNPNLRPDQIDKLLYDSGWDFQKGKLINPVGFVKAARAAGQ